MKALLKNYRQPPRKVRLVADLIRGKSVLQAKAALAFLPKKSTPAIEKLIASAVANARNIGISEEGLFVKKITVDKGSVMRRYRPFARGRAGTVDKISSIISLELGTKEQAESVAPKAAKKTTTKRSSTKAKAPKAKASK